MSGFPGITATPGPFSVAGLLSTPGGTSTAGEGGLTSPVPVSGAAFTPNATKDCNLYLAVVATTAGTYGVTMGPTTGTENTPVPVLNVVAGVGDSVAIRVPAGWKVVATLTGVTVAFGTCLAVPC